MIVRRKRVIIIIIIIIIITRPFLRYTMSGLDYRRQPRCGKSCVSREGRDARSGRLNFARSAQRDKESLSLSLSLSPPSSARRVRVKLAINEGRKETLTERGRRGARGRGAVSSNPGFRTMRASETSEPFHRTARRRAFAKTHR